MNPIVQEALETLRREIDIIRNGKDLQAVENLKREIDAIVAGVKDNSVATINQAVDENGAATYSVAADYDAKVRVTISGTDYYIGLYNV